MLDLEALVGEITRRVTEEVLVALGTDTQSEWPEYDEYNYPTEEPLAASPVVVPVASTVAVPSASNLEWAEPPSASVEMRGAGHRLSGEQLAALYQREVLHQRAIAPI